MKQTRILAVAAPEHARALEKLLETEQLNRVVTISATADNLDKAGAIPADALVIYTNTLTAYEYDFLERLFMTRSRLCMILVCDEFDAEMLTRAMRCGVTRVHSMSDGQEAICQTILAEVERISSRQLDVGASGFDARVVSVFSTKGGTGKTTIAVNLAVAMKKAGKKVALLDFDLQFGDVGVFLDINHPDSISDIVTENDFKYQTIKNYLFEHSSGVQVLCAPSSPELADMVKPEHIEKIVTALRPEFDCLVIDLPPALSDCSITALEQCDVIYFVTMPDISTLRNSKVCNGVLKSLMLDSKVRMVLNKDGFSSLSRKEVEAALETKIVLSVPYDVKTAVAAVNRGVPFVQSAPSAKMSKALFAFAKKGVDN